MSTIGMPTDWKPWMQALGRTRRRIRELLGLSQDQLARLSGVSQGAVSRLEAGRGLATPLVVVLKIDAALHRVIAGRDGDVVSDEVREYYELVARLLPDTASKPDSPVVARDPMVEELLRIFRNLSDRQRGRLLSVVRATAAALTADEPELSVAEGR